MSRRGPMIDGLRKEERILFWKGYQAGYNAGSKRNTVDKLTSKNIDLMAENGTLRHKLMMAGLL